jgi:hypothetical protein
VWKTERGRRKCLDLPSSSWRHNPFTTSLDNTNKRLAAWKSASKNSLIMAGPQKDTRRRHGVRGGLKSNCFAYRRRALLLLLVVVLPSVEDRTNKRRLLNGVRCGPEEFGISLPFSVLVSVGSRFGDKRELFSRGFSFIRGTRFAPIYVW